MATVTGSKRHLDITSNTLTTSSNVDVGAKLFITTTDTNTTSTSALVLNSTEVEARTLGSLAFSSATYDNYGSWNLKTNDTQRTTVSSGGDLNIVAGTNAGVAYSAGGTVTISSTDTTYSAGTLLDLSSTTFNVDLSELTNNTATFAPTQDHFVILDNGVQGKKLGSSIFGSAAYEASSAFATASHSHAGTYALEYENLAQASGAEHDMHQWRKVHASYSNNSGNLDYLVIQTEVPQDNYSMGGFTLVYQDNYNTSGEGGEIKIYGYWNPEVNGGFQAFRYECSNPYHTPTIEVCRNSSSGNTAFFISGEGGNYAQLIAKDLWFGYTASSATAQWGNGWVISEASDKTGYTNFDTLDRNDFAAITTNGSTPSLTGGVSAAEVRTLIGAGTSSSDTTYSAGTGLTLTNTTFSVTANTYAAASHNHDDRYYTETESDARYPRGVTKTYSSVDTASDVDSWYKFFQITDSGNSPVVCYLRGYAHSSVAFIVSEGYLGGNAHIQILDYLTSTNNNYKWIKGVRIINNGDVEVLLNGGATVSLEMTIIGDAAYVSVPALSSAAAGNVVDSVTSLTNGMIRAKGTISGGNTGNWDTAYSWGNHASGGYMSSFILEDGDGTEVSISNGKEVKFVEGTGININWSDTSTGSDSDPYDLTFNIKNNSIGADQINVSGDGSSGQVLTSDGDGTMSWTNKTANTDTITSVGVANSEVSGTVTLSGAGATSLTQTDSTIEIRSTDTQYNDATTSTAGLMSTTDKSKLDGIESGAEVNVQSDWNATSGDSFIQNKPTLGTASASAATDFISATSADTAAELITFAKGTTTDGNSKFYNWRALDNTASTGNSFWRIARITGTHSSRFMITLAGRSTSYSDTTLPAMGHIVGQLSNDNNYDVVFYNHSTASSEAVQEIGIVNVSNTVVDVYVKAGQYAELTATGHISDGSFVVYSNTGSDGNTTVDGYITVTEYTAYNSGNLTPLTIGTTSTTAMAGNTAVGDSNVQSDWNATTGDAFIKNKPTLGTAAATASTDYATAAQGLLADSALQSLPSHNHNDLYYTESEMQHFMARALGWVSGYGNASTSYVNYNFTEDAIALSGVGDTSTGAIFKAIRVKAGDKVRFTIMLKGTTASTDGLYIRLYAYNGDMPDGKTHVSNNSGTSEIVVVEESSGDTGWEENRAVPNVWTNYERTYTAGNDGYVSLVVLNWTGHGNETIYLRQPDIQFEKVYDASNLGGTAASSYLTGIAANSVGITELNVTDGTSGQVLTTNGSGTLSFSTVTSGGSDTNYYLDGIERTDGTNTLVFSVSGATNQSFTFGANAFNSTTIPAAEQYTAHEDTSTLSGVYGDTANGTKIDTITVDANGHITAIATGATGNMTGFFVEDGDGTEVQINNANEWKFVQGAGISINWTDTSNGIDTDPYDLTIACTIDSPGEVGLGNLSSSGNALAGTFTATGDIIAYSDARVKENVETIPNALEKVTALRGVNFNKIGEEKRSTGVIAQEVAEIIPEVVHESEDGMLGVAYGNITGLLIEAIKEQQKQIDELKAKLDGSTK
jgi:hypothetical protein